MASPHTMTRHEERRVPMHWGNPAQQFMCIVHKLHSPLYRVSVARAGEARPFATVHVNAREGSCTCGEPERCVHRSSVRHADPTAVAIWGRPQAHH